MTVPTNDPPVTNPYVGPRAFRTADAALFHGRSREADRLRLLWRTERLVVLHGLAAVGKTSLLRAGVLPLLAADEDVEVLPVGSLVPPARPVAADAGRNPYVTSLVESWGGAGRRLSVAEFVRTRVARWRDGRADRPEQLLAPIDHVEGLFAGYPARTEAWLELLDELAAALAAVEVLNLLLVVRDDHLPLLEAQDSALGDQVFVRLRLGPLSRAAAIAAVEAPAEGAGRSYAPDAAGALVDGLRTVPFKDVLGNDLTVTRSTVDPLPLQIACRRLWEALPDGTAEIILAQVRQHGGRSALRAYYDAAVAAVARRPEPSEQQIRGWLARTFVTELGTRGSAHRGLTTTAGMANEVVDALVEWQILTTELRFELLWYQVGQDLMIPVILEGAPPPVVIDGDSFAAYRSAAEAALRVGDLETALRYARTSVARAGDRREQALAHELLGDCARADGRLQAAEEAYGRAQSTFTDLLDGPAAARTLTLVAELRMSAGKYADAIALQRQAISRLPDDRDALTGLGNAQRLDGSPADAVATFNRVLGNDRRVAPALAGRGQAQADLRHYQDARADLERAMELGHPEEPALYSALALALAGLGHPGSGHVELNLARQLAPDDPWTRLRAGRIAELAGDRELARAELTAALTVVDGVPALPRAHQELVRASIERLARPTEDDTPPTD